MEFVEHGSLSEVLVKPLVNFSWFLRIKIALDMACGLQYMHSKNILHRDMKSPNIMLASLIPTNPTVAKIADFGTSTLELGSGENVVIHGTRPEIPVGPDKWNNMTERERCAGLNLL